MRIRLITHLLLVPALAASLQAVSSVLPEASKAAPPVADGPAKEAMAFFQEGKHAKAVEIAKPLADKGDPDALYLMGFAHESGKGVEISGEKALDYYRKAEAAKHQDAVYRMSFILLASEKKEDREQARVSLEAAAGSDPTVASRILGEAYLRGRLTEEADPAKAISWWKKAADAGDVSSVLLMARFYEGQFGFPELKNIKDSLANYTKAAELGDTGAMAALGSRLLSGDEKNRDEAKGREWIKRAIAGKEYSGYLALGDYEENIKKDLKAALSEYERGKDAGQIDCVLRAADFYIQGKGTEKDTTRGLALLEKAAESGNPMANLRLAVQSFSKEKADMLVGYKYLLAAANGNLPEAQNELGLLYLSGKLAGVDSAAGVAWLTRAAQAGYPQSQNNLATLYERGAAGVSQSIGDAAQLYSLAATQGHGPATLALARILNEGIGAKADPVKAFALAMLAAERGEEAAQKMVMDLTTQLDDSQEADAKKQLGEMKSTKPAAVPKKKE
jgi:uncharacterized protein